jgi:hypothetical protein
MWFREVDLSAVTRWASLPCGVTAFLFVLVFVLSQGGPALAGAVGQDQNESQATQSTAAAVPAPAVEQLYPAAQLPAAARHEGSSVNPVTLIPDSVTAAPSEAVARFADDGVRPSLLETATPPAASGSQSLIPTVQAFAAASAAGDLGKRMIFDAPDTNESHGPQQLIPLPPAGWTGMMGLVSLGVVGKLRRLRRRF